MTTRLNKFRSSNSKEVKEAIRSHIIERLDPDYEGFEGSLADKLENVIKGFKKWLGPNGMRHHQTYQDAFKAYLQCIPSTLAAEFATCYQEQALNEWMGTPDYERSADRIGDVYYALIYREFRKLCELNNVQF